MAGTTFPDPIPVTGAGPILRDSFAGASVNLSKWVPTIGTGGAISQSSGTLTMGSGTTANAETSLLSQQMFSLPCKVGVGLSLSQRIANQTFFVELVSVNPDTGLPNGQELAGFVFDGTTATNARHQVTTGALAPNAVGASFYPTTATVGLFEIEASADEVWFFGTAGIDFTAPRGNTYRLSNRAPDPSAVYKVRLRWLNGATPPASSTNALITYFTCAEYQKLAAEIVSGRGNATGGAGIAINNTPLVFPSPNPSVFATAFSLNSAATNNATLVKGSAGNLYEVTWINRSASVRYWNFYNNSGTPVPGTTQPIFSIIMPANSWGSTDFGPYGKRFATGIGYSITGGAALLDNTAIAAGDVQVSGSFI